MKETADQIRMRAQSLAQQGDMQGALKVAEEGLSHHPDNARLCNSAGDFAMRSGDPSTAERHFRRATKLRPDDPDFAINLAIALGAQDRHAEALAVLDRHRANGEHDPRYCSARANSARALRDLDQAERWYDRCLALAPNQARALHGRARIAIERGDPDAVQRFEAAVAANRSDPHAWLGLAEALNAAAETARARELAQSYVEQAPQWIDALRLLAQLRLAAGEEDFDAHFAQASAKRPADPGIPRAHITVLEGHDRFADALEVALSAEKRFPEETHFALMVGTLAGYLGKEDLAKDRFARLGDDAPTGWLMEARLHMQMGDLDHAASLLDKLLATRPSDIDGWAMRDLLWRLSDDDRTQWLHGQDGLVRLIELPDAEQVLAEVVPVLHRLHDQSTFPLGQSLRGGSQTRGLLFDRREPELQRLHQALMAALELYREQLPPRDETHPLLKWRDAPWSIAGSWSVRLNGGGDFHASHLHPQGLLSSALYCELPDEMSEENQQERAGWLELGSPPAKMHLDLDPLAQIEPKEGHLALFPSTLYHGTRPFSQGRRLTVAFDVVTARQQP